MPEVSVSTIEEIEYEIFASVLYIYDSCLKFYKTRSSKSICRMHVDSFKLNANLFNLKLETINPNLKQCLITKILDIDVNKQRKIDNLVMYNEKFYSIFLVNIYYDVYIKEKFDEIYDEIQNIRENSVLLK